jgi:hypothetical protein
MTGYSVEEIEISIKEAKKHVDKMHSLQKLTNNQDFIKVILEGYFENEASRLVLLKADSNMQDEANQTHINKAIDSVGYLRQYFSAVMQLGRMAEKSIDESEATKQEMLAEELEQ